MGLGLRMPVVPSPRVLVVGNSATIQSNFWDYLTDAARSNAVPVHLARASANGARLIETLRIAPLRKLLRDVDWDVVVMQDFSSTALNSEDRLASDFAIRAMARLARPASVVLFPHWPSAPGHSVYRGGLGSHIATPKNLADYAARSQTHYERTAAKCGGVVVPVLAQWETAVSSGKDLYVGDRHHANRKGAELAAHAVWRTVAGQL